MAAKTALKAEIVSVLRSRGLEARADWFDRELSEVVDLPHNRSLLSTLGIDPMMLAEADDVSCGQDP
ncbi:hypothetical protein [Actinoplanes sp. NPDC049316]|uniref:hypothetical protein n=1 Tax=Actinoplanes sp. NPDC049316 TaxID=3154727 RepID=UPI00342DC12E